jgi:hypothetical protein
LICSDELTAWLMRKTVSRLAARDLLAERTGERDLPRAGGSLAGESGQREHPMDIAATHERHEQEDPACAVHIGYLDIEPVAQYQRLVGRPRMRRTAPMPTPNVEKRLLARRIV